MGHQFEAEAPTKDRNIRVWCSSWLHLKDDKRIIGTNGLICLDTYIDAAHAVHMDMKSHTGGAMTFEIGIISAKSSKQKLNTKSSTEAEVVGASDYIDWFVLWVCKQRYNTKAHIKYPFHDSYCYGQLQ